MRKKITLEIPTDIDFLALAMFAINNGCILELSAKPGVYRLVKKQDIETAAARAASTGAIH